jgi:dihydrofolate reductase
LGNSTLIKGEVPSAITELKKQLSGDLVVLGSGALLQSLMQHDLVDEFLLSIHPLVLGAGRRRASSLPATRRRRFLLTQERPDVHEVNGDAPALDAHRCVSTNG